MSVSVTGQQQKYGPVCFETASLVGGVFDNNICLVVLKLAQRQQDDISLINPDLYGKSEC